MATRSLTRRLPGRWPWWAAGATGVVILVAMALTNLGSSPPAGSRTYPERTVSAGAVTVGLQLRSIDTAAATISVVFDTHSVALDLDVAREARLVVGGTVWPVDRWSGDRPGGHHRQGELRFTGAGPVTGTATLTLGGLPKPVAASWQVPP